MVKRFLPYTILPIRGFSCWQIAHGDAVRGDRLSKEFSNSANPTRLSAVIRNATFLSGGQSARAGTITLRLRRRYWRIGQIMDIRQHQAELDYLTQRVSQLLGEEVRLFQLDWDLEAILLRQLRREATFGLGSEPAIRQFHGGRHGRGVRCGMVRYAIEVDGSQVPVIQVNNPFSEDREGLLNDFWAVPARLYQRLYRNLRRTVRNRLGRTLPPVMQAEDLQRLWENTIGFLRRGEEALRRFGVVLKRGLLLTGEPGNGKTLAARWLQSQAIKHNLEWRSVSAEEYENARREGECRELFRLSQPGFVLFDDFDSALQHRDSGSSPVDSSTFLCELDGVDARSGVVYLFTSNIKWERLDPAFRRPGRIDCVFRFDRPTVDLRRRLICERWPAELVAELPVEEVVAALDGRSFAEIEEVRKLLVIHYLETGEWDWPSGRSRLAEREGGSTASRAIGFSAAAGTSQPAQLVACNDNDHLVAQTPVGV